MSSNCPDRVRLTRSMGPERWDSTGDALFLGGVANSCVCVCVQCAQRGDGGDRYGDGCWYGCAGGDGCGGDLVHVQICRFIRTMVATDMEPILAIHLATTIVETPSPTGSRRRAGCGGRCATNRPNEQLECCIGSAWHHRSELDSQKSGYECDELKYVEMKCETEP